jgi:carbon-monoxide dehydrogenase large subunit
MGGVLQALGQVLGEQLVYDADGQLQTASLMDYSVLRADVSPNFVLEHQEIAAQSNPLGVKGAGESGVAGALPAAVNAILHALSYRGIQHMDLPFTSGRVWAALHRS